MLANVAFPPRRRTRFPVFSTVASLPEGHPAHGKTQKDKRATVYVCRGQSCSLPITDPAELAEAFSRG